MQTVQKDIPMTKFNKNRRFKLESGLMLADYLLQDISVQNLQQDFLMLLLKDLQHR